MKTLIGVSLIMFIIVSGSFYLTEGTQDLKEAVGVGFLFALALFISGYGLGLIINEF